MEVPGSPSGLTVNALSPTRIKVSWQDNSDNEDGFRIYRNGNKIATVGPNTTSYVHKNLSSDTRYCYQVVSYNQGGESESTNRNCTVTLISIPQYPSNLSTDVLHSNRIKVSWQDNSDNEDGFRIYRNGNKIATVGPNTTSYTDTGLSPGTSYSYAVTAFNDSGESGVSSTVDTMTTEAIVEEEEPEPEPEEVPKTEERPLSEVQLLAGIGIVLMVMGYIYSEIG